MEDYDCVLKVIFGEGYEKFQENSDINSYLSELSTYSIDKFVKEPERLAEERANILEQTQDLAFSNYKTFIQTADCSREIFQDFKYVEKDLESVSSQLPKFREQCNLFSDVAQKLSTQRRLNSLTLSKHTQILEVLELPQLMDTCVRRGYFQHALELSQHVKRMEKKHPQIPIVASIVSEIQKSLQLMLSQLLSQLRSSLQLPQCLEVIGYIRQMGVFTESELRIQFLQTRDFWFQGLLAAVPKDDPYQHISKTMELSRVHLFDIITQYRVIFRDDDPVVSSGNVAIFTGWVLQKVEQFLETLEHDLSRGVGGRLDSVLGQCMYFGLSLSRVGADFRPLLHPIFITTTKNSFKFGLEEALLNLSRNLQDYVPINKETVAASGLNDPLHPPMSLVEFPPLAELCNDLLVRLNELRLFAPLAVSGFVCLELSNCLKEAAESFYSLSERHRGEGMVKLAECFIHDLLPYLDHILQTVYPPDQLSLHLGIPVSQLLQENFCSLNVNEINVPLIHLVPVPSQDIITENLEVTQNDALTETKTDSVKAEDEVEEIISVTEQSNNEDKIEPEQESDSPSLKVEDGVEKADVSEQNNKGHKIESEQESDRPSLKLEDGVEIDVSEQNNKGDKVESTEDVDNQGEQSCTGNKTKDEHFDAEDSATGQQEE